MMMPSRPQSHTTLWCAVRLRVWSSPRMPKPAPSSVRHPCAQLYRTTLPAHDLPVDLVASILRDVSADPRRVDELCEDAPEAMLAKISCEPAEPTSFALMERWMERSAGDEELGPSLAELASGHRFESLLFEPALLRSADDELRQGLEDFLRPRRPEQVLAEEAE